MKTMITTLALAVLAMGAIQNTGYAMGQKKPSEDATDVYRTIRLQDQHMSIDSEREFTFEAISGETSLTLRYKARPADSFSKYDSDHDRKYGSCDVRFNIVEGADGLKSDITGSYILDNGYSACISDRIQLAECVRQKKKITFVYNETRTWISSFSCK